MNAHHLLYVTRLLVIRRRQVINDLNRQPDDDSDRIGMDHEIDTIDDLAGFLGINVTEPDA